MSWGEAINLIKDKGDSLLLRTETFSILKIIIKRENELFNHNEEFNLFFDHLVALVAESMAQIPISVSQSKLLSLFEGLNVIIRYIIGRFQTPNPPAILLKALKVMCEVDVSFENVNIYSTIKNMKYPETCKTTSAGSSDKDSSPKSEVKRSRSELSMVIIQQLSQPVRDRGSVPLTNFSETQFDFKDAWKMEVLDILKSLNASDVLLKWCIKSIPIISSNFTLKYDGGSLTLNQKTLHLPMTYADASAVRQCLKQIEIDISNILCVLNLPIIDILNPEKIANLSQLSMTSTYSGIVAMVAHSLGLLATSSSVSAQSTSGKSSSSNTLSVSVATKESSSSPTTANIEVDLMEETSKNIVNMALEINNIVNEVLKKSTQHNIYQNHVCMSAWLMLTGIQVSMTAASGSQKAQSHASEDPSKAKATPVIQQRINLFKVQQSFGILNNLIAKHAIALLDILLEELKIDCANGLDNKYPEDILINQQPLSAELINFHILNSYSSMERLLCVFNGTTIQQLMTFVGTITYRKAFSLKHLTEFGGEQLSYSDSTTYFNDTLSCSEDETDTEEDERTSDEEEDSEDYLGSWLKEALSPEAYESDKDKTQKVDEGQKAANSQANRDEPHEYLELASIIFKFLDVKLGDPDNVFLLKYVKHGLSEQQMVLLANILKDLDSDVQMAVNNNVQAAAISKELSNDAVNAAVRWMSCMVEFSSSIGKYMHNMISNGILSESLSSILLQNLNVSPWSTETNTWPLEIYSRIISVVVQILLLKPSQEKEAACLSVWHRLVNTLVEGVCGPNNSQFDDYEDLNIEHAQMLLFLFHSLNLMQKKSVLLLVAGGIIRCAEVCRNISPEKPLRDNQLILLSRLLLFFEYLMKHLYSPPNILLEQVSWNLFSLFSASSNDSEEKSVGLVGYKTKMMSFYRKDIEEKYRKLSTVHDGITIKPKLYSLTVLDLTKPNEFKLDGLAWNFILCTPDKVKYPLLIDSLISILNITDMSSGKVPHHSQFSIYYCFSLAWKLLLGLPPSTSHVENLMSLEDKQVNLHTLLWSTRCLSKPVSNNVHSHNLIVDCLIRQGMYTQAAETMWSNLTEKLNDHNHLLELALFGLDNFLQSFQNQHPKLSKIILLDSLMSHLFSYNCVVANSDSSKISEASNDVPKNKLDETLCSSLIEKLVQTIEILMTLYNKTMSQNLSGQLPQKIIDSIIAISGTRNTTSNELAESLVRGIQSSDKDVLTIEWKRPMTLSDESNQPEQSTLNIVESHIAEIYRHPNYSMLLSIKSVVRSIINWIHFALPYGKGEPKLQELLVAMLFDSRTDYLYDVINKCIETLLGTTSESEEYQLLIFRHLLLHSYTILIEFCDMSASGKATNIDESVLLSIIKFWESTIEKPFGMKALREFFYEQKIGNLANILVSFTGTSLSQQYCKKILRFFETLFTVSESIESDFTMEEICIALSDLGKFDSGKLKVWLGHILLGPKGISSAESSNVPTPERTPTNLGTQSSRTPLQFDCAEAMEIDEEYSRSGLSFWTHIAQTSATINDQAVHEVTENNGKLLQNLTKHFAGENRLPHHVTNALFLAMVQLGQSFLTNCQVIPESVMSDFTSLLQVMVTLADADHGRGHFLLFTSVVEWIEICKNRVLEKCSKSNAPISSSSTKVLLENSTLLMKYLSDLLIGLNGQQKSISSTIEDDMIFDIEELISNDPQAIDEDSEIGENFDEDSANTKLCTFTITQKDFMNQHWYWCFTCKMIDDKGCCSVCAKVCHKNHDVVYAKNGNFYCDCGAKEDGSCQAMSMLDNSSSVLPSALADSNDVVLNTTLKHQTSNAMTSHDLDQLNLAKPHFVKNIDGSKDQLNNPEMWKNVLKSLLSYCSSLLSVVRENCASYSNVGCHLRAKNALNRLHEPDKSLSYNDQIMVAIMGSQEGAFENVRMNYSGDQGQTIRQLLSSNLIRRVALCCLASPLGKRQHLAVSHEKGKVTILQLSTLLKQADAAKKKLTLTRLSSVPINCTVLSLAANPANEDFLAVCGLRECHVLTFSSSGSVSDHIVLSLQHDSGNYLKRAIWLPGSQTKLALVTAEYVKIYDLAEDSLSPLYNFVVPSGDIRDICFILRDDVYYILIMSSLGYIYFQPLSEESLATNGAFYVTSTLDLEHSHIRDVDGQILGGGVSIYYSHMLQMLFFSFALGRSFMAPLVDLNEGVKCVLTLLHNSKTFSKSNTSSSQSALVQWMEIAGHPGIVCAMMQNSNNPVIFMLKPDGYLVQEIKAQSSKAKIMDMVAIRHRVSGTEKTTLILLCEDGSLRIYTANPDITNFWLSHEVQPNGNFYSFNSAPKDRKSKSKKVKALMKPTQTASLNGNPNFPVDFFEHCTPLNDVEFGGNDLLEVYHVQQLQNRLNTTGLYVAITRFNGFTLEVMNKDPNMVIAGIRFLIGSQDISRAPTAVSVYGRKVPTICTRARWFAVPLSREESLKSDKKLSIHFSPSQDPEFVTILDSIKIYGKTKETLGFLDEGFEESALMTNTTAAKEIDQNAFTVTALDKTIVNLLDVVDSGFYYLGGSIVDSSLKQQAIDVTTSLILLPTPGIVQQISRSVLATLHPTKTSYHLYKDREILSEVYKELQVMLGVDNFTKIDPEAFYRIVLMIRNIAIQRPQQLTKLCQENNYNILNSLMSLEKQLKKVTSTFNETIIRNGLTHKEATVQSLIEIIYAFIYTDQTNIEQMVKYIVELLLDKDHQISHNAKYALIRLLRPKTRKQKKVLIEPLTPPSCQTPTPTISAIATEDSASGSIQDVDLIEPLGLVPENRDLEPTLEVLLAGMAGAGRDVHGEALMEFALELYLQGYDGDIHGIANRLRGNQAFQAVAAAAGIDLGAVGNAARVNSAGGSDDDDEAASNAATDGSRDVNQLLATSPTVEHLMDNSADNASGNSDGSGADSIGGISGRSSTSVNEDQIAASTTSPPKPMTSKLESVKDDEEIPDSDATKLHHLRILILESLVDNFSLLKDVNGRQVIPFMQVVLMLTSDLDGFQEHEKNIMSKLLAACIEKLEISPATQASKLSKRTSKSEVQLIILRFVGILMGKVKTLTSKSGSSSSASASTVENIQFVASATANHLLKAGGILYCLTLLEAFLPYWKHHSSESSSSNQASGSITITTSGGTHTNSLLKPTVYGPLPDMQPFFARQYIKGLSDIFELYPQVLTEMAVRLIHLILKITNGNQLSQQHTYDSAHMTFILCEYMMHMNSPVLRRQVRKLLLYICGNKERYRKLRDLHSLNEHIKSIKTSIVSGSITYQSLVSLMDHLKACFEVASARTGNWQRFCLLNDTLPSLLSLSCQHVDHEQISTITLQLLQSAVVNVQQNSSIPQEPAAITGAQSKKDRKDRDKSEEMEGATADSKFDTANCTLLVQQIFQNVSIPNLTTFIKTFLLESSSVNIRWLAHDLIYGLYENCNEANKVKLLQILWGLWTFLPAYGKRAPQFVDLLGYFTLNTKTALHLLPEKINCAVQLLREQNELIQKHPSAPIYSSLRQFLDLEGYYMESEPCLICNNIDQTMSVIKLTSIKADSKFTSNSNIVKLINSHMISKIILRISDLKKTKMVRTINVYYNSRNVQAVVELKNRPSMWHRAKSVTLQSGQTDVKIELSLPITASNLMFEYEDFYETVTSLPESLQCPRCSATVPANPGVCTNCGEHVFQCHKCRAIHYDEKDPFLCHSCGFCKYAKFEYSIFGRSACSVDPVESDDDRAKTDHAINNLLEKADKSYREILSIRQILEVLIPKAVEGNINGDYMSGNHSSTLHINKTLQQIEKKYCNEGRTHYEDLTKIVQKIQACRREIVAYDRCQMDSSAMTTTLTAEADDSPVTKCYGCALASVEQIICLLKFMATQVQYRVALCQEGLIEELVSNNLRHGSGPRVHDEVRSLLCLLTRDLPDPSVKLCNLLTSRVMSALDGSVPFSNLDQAVCHEMALLEAMAMQEDSCWQLKLRPIVSLFLKASEDPRGPANILQTCLRVIQTMCNPPLPTSKKNKGKSNEEMCSIKQLDLITVNPSSWLAGDNNHSFEAWRARQTTKTAAVPPPTLDPKAETFASYMMEERNFVRQNYLSEKYGRLWHLKVIKKKVQGNMPLKLIPSYLPSILFHPTSKSIRVNACALVTSWMTTYERKLHLVNLLTCFLKFIGESGENSAEFIELYRKISQETPLRQSLALNNVLVDLTQLIDKEFAKIYKLEETTTLSTDLSQGYALKQYVDLISLFLENVQIRKVYKQRVLQSIIQSYLNLRKLVVQRTMMIDEAQKNLMLLLEELTSGTEEETANFMSICIDIVRKTQPNDLKTPLFMFERLCSTIHSEDSDNDEFFLNLEKDQLQEEFIQGRMLGNPYPSSESGIGPLMRDVKNKICFDCEIMAMLEDDNGMELLVSGKIISLDLPVKDVYKHVWLASGGDRDTMRIVYRIRGLSGDATEEFVETLKPVKGQEEDNEQIYRMVNVVADCGGLKVMLDRMTYLQNVSKAKPFLQVLLKLFLMCVKVKKCREELCQPELGAISTLLKVLHLCLQHQVHENDSQMTIITEQLLEIMETILAKAASDTLDSFLQFSLTFGGPEYIEALLSCTNHANVRNNPHVLRCLIRVVAALVYGNDIKMSLLLDHFNECFDFEKFDSERTAEEEFQIELFCILSSAIERNSIGGILKDHIMGLGIVEKAVDYINKHSPQNRSVLLSYVSDSEELKMFISRPSLKYILQFLSGLATKHEKTQLVVAKDLIPIIHQLEQVSSDEHVGSLAENLLEALCSEPATAKTVQEYRESTRAEKKRLAMATREKQLNAMGMRTNDKGQVTAKEQKLQEMEKLAEETGLTCFICREGYACQPTRVIGIYTFTKRCPLEEFEQKNRKTMGYNTVSHFNVVHVDCHMSAIRLARGRDEWESASLQNANTKCNGLLPLWGPEVSETAFSACMARHHSYMQESTQRIEITFASGIHDLKLLLLRFAHEKTFHDDCGGGGPQSNMQLVPYLMFFALYISLSTRSYVREEKNLTAFLNQPVGEKWLESSYEVDGPVYQSVLSIVLHSYESWKKNRVHFLKRLLVAYHTRHLYPTTNVKYLNGVGDKDVKDFSVYKPGLMVYALVDLIYRHYFAKVVNPKEEDWPVSIFNYIRRNDEAMMKSASTTLETFKTEFQPCTSFGEFCDVAELLCDIEDPDAFLVELIDGLPGSGGK